ncbi:MAG: hypothetical protein HYX48_04395 [Chlamydiales bacterium]|nr:hypothetical protein [Chlamydiales bacterium]
MALSNSGKTFQRCALAACLSLVALTAGCGKDQPSDERMSAVQMQHAAPSVSIVPVFDRTENNGVSWNLSDELTTVLSRKLGQKEKLHVTGSQKVRAATKKLIGSRDPFSADLSWMKRIFPEDQFVVFMELLKHEEVAASSTAPEASPADLQISMKLRIVDLRADSPRIVLQEIIHDNQHLPKHFNRAHIAQVAWGQDNFHISPIGVAHAKLIKELSTRIEDYVLLAARR